MIAQLFKERFDASESAGVVPPKEGARTFTGGKGYVLAAAALSGAFLLRIAFDPLWVDRLAYAWFFVAVLLVARFAGVGPQLVTALGGLMLGDLFFVHPRGSLEIAATVDRINAGIYCGVMAIIMVFIAKTRRMVTRELAARDRIAGILECTSDAVCTVDAHWKVTYLNARACELTGLTIAKVAGRDYWEVWPGLKGTRFEREYRRVMAIGETVHFEEFNPVQQSWTEVHGCRYGSGMAIFFRDVTHRKREEASRAQLAAIVESSDDAIIGLSMEGSIVSWNAAADRLYGYPAEEVTGRSFEMLFPTQRSIELRPMLDQVRRGERVDHFETTQRRNGGGGVEVSLTISPVQMKDREIVGISITARDVSERKRQEMERERLIRELRAAMAEVKTLSGLLPICAQCKKIRDDRGYWNQIESFIGERSNAKFSHGICPDCVVQLYPDFAGSE